jgi:hypothetical protein
VKVSGKEDLYNTSVNRYTKIGMATKINEKTGTVRTQITRTEIDLEKSSHKFEE